ncbi:MAG TPA: 4a-hydroxytetrahydrobiopterin dehydratase [Nitriliruptorales bacterium]|nr:4a-hydroxytetrahydrobiopterin dehydratase [Nitriliruptorales bacterium]
MEPLTEQQIEEALVTLPGWEYDGEAITKTFGLGSFREAIDFVQDVADLAEEANHHPDLEIYYDEVVVSFRTHSADAVTDNDVRMAAEVESLVSEFEDEALTELDEDFDEDLDQVDVLADDEDQPGP